MTNAKDLYIFNRSFSGDWQSRIDLFKKFIWDNPRVRPLAAGQQNQDDFLHDCFTNVLRTGHAFGQGQDLGDWIESVAAWTALERRRFRDESATEATRPVRLCAGPEGDEPGGRSRLASYVPPRSGPEDTLRSRISALVGEPQFTLLSQRAIEGSTWEELAASAGKPRGTIGPMLVRAVDFLCRFFGAPPPLNDDLEPVFTAVVRADASTTHGDPLKPKGRIHSMQLDPGFYALTPEMRQIGLAVPAAVRTVTLWDAARSSFPPNEALRDHLAQCSYCADLLRAMLLMQRALQRSAEADFQLCPGGFTLLNIADDEPGEAFNRHLDACDACREELSRARGAEERSEKSAPQPSESGWGKKVAWAAALLVVLGGAYMAGSRIFKPADQPVLQSSVPESPTPEVKSDPRYNGIAQAVAVNDPRWLTSVLPQNRRRFSELLDLIQQGQLGEASIGASGLVGQDPGIQMLYARLQYQLKGMGDGYRELLKAEAMPPRNSFRCWVTLQGAIILGDKKTATREVEHLSADPEYAGNAKTLLARMRAIG